MGDGAHRHQRAHRQVPGAEVGPGRPALEAVGQDRPHVVAAQARRGSRRRPPVASPTSSSSSALQLGALPGVASGRRGQRVGDAGQRVGPAVDRRGAGRASTARAAGGRRTPPTGPASSMSPLSTSSSGSVAAEEPLPLVGHRDAEQHPVQPGLPGVGLEALELERRAVLGVEAPADAGAATHSSSRDRSSSLEAEPAAHRLAAGQVEHLGGRDPGASASSRTSARTPMTGLVWRSDRSARRTSSVRARVVLVRRSGRGRRTSPGSAGRRSRCRGT